MSVFFSLDSFKMCFHFQNLVLWYYLYITSTFYMINEVFGSSRSLVIALYLENFQNFVNNSDAFIPAI